MCRRCGEPDKRGNSLDRLRRKRRFLREFGDGITCPCAWCGVTLTIFTVEADRLDPRGTYRWDNVVPACGPCNRARLRWPGPPAEGCEYG